MKKLNLVALASGGGTNLQAIIDNIEAGKLNAQIRAVISNNSKSGALERARKHNIPAIRLLLRGTLTPQQCVVQYVHHKWFGVRVHPDPAFDLRP